MEMPLLNIISRQDEETARKLIVPWSPESFPNPHDLKESGLYWNYCQCYSKEKEIFPDKQPEIGKILFDLEGRFFHRIPDRFNEQDSNLVSLVMGSVPSNIVWANMKGRPIPPQGAEYFLPKQFVYLTLLSKDSLAISVPMFSGRMPVSSSNPIIYYIKLIEDKKAVGVLVPHRHMTEVPETIMLHLS